MAGEVPRGHDKGFGVPPTGGPAGPKIDNKGAPPVDVPWEPDKPGAPPVSPPDTPTPKQPNKPGTPPGNNPPVDPPANPLPPNEPMPAEPTPDPGPPITPTPNPQGPGTGGDFSKGQPYQDVLGASKGQPPEDFYGSGRGFDPYFGRNRGIQPGRGATSYDPLGIGADAYTDPNADVWSMTGVNSVLQPGAKVRPRFGVVGGNGGYGYGMVSQDYTGPLANDARPLVKELRKQRRQLNRATVARKGGPGVVDGPGGFGGNAANNGGGSGTVNGPGGFGSAGGNMDWKGQPSGGTEGAAGGAGGAGSKWGAPPAAASGAQPEPAVVGGSGTGTTGGLGTPSTDALGNALGWNPAWGTPMDSFGAAAISPQEYNQRRANTQAELAAFNANPANRGRMPVLGQDVFKNAIASGSFNTPFGNLVTSSTGNRNVYKLNGASENDGLYYYNPAGAGQWNRMSPGEYAQRAGSMDWNYYDPEQSEAMARRAGATGASNYW